MTARFAPSAPSGADDATHASGAPADAYGAIADAYDRFWGEALAPELEPVLVRLLGPAAPVTRLLDLCCGAGQLTAAFAAAGAQVVAVDGSPALVARARRRAPAAEYVVADLRRLEASGVLAPHAPFDAAVCVFDSLNHLATTAELASVFRAVRAALRPGGRFVFDVNGREGFEARFDGSLAFVADDLVCAVRAQLDGAEGRYDLTVFRPAPAASGPAADAPAAWRRSDATLVQHCFEVAEIVAALDAAGFEAPTVLDAEADLGLEGHIGRLVFVADRPAAGRGGAAGA